MEEYEKYKDMNTKLENVVKELGVFSFFDILIAS